MIRVHIGAEMPTDAIVVVVVLAVVVVVVILVVLALKLLNDILRR